MLQQKAAVDYSSDDLTISHQQVKFQKKLDRELGMRFAVMLDKVVCMVVQQTGLGYVASGILHSDLTDT